MFKFGTELKVGITALVGLLIVGYMSMRVNDAPFWKGKTKSYYVIFDNASELLLKSPVYISGIRVGYVEEMDLLDHNAKVKMSGIDSKIPIYADAKVFIKEIGLLGEKVIEIDAGNDKSHPLADNSVILNSESKTKMDRVFGELEKVSTLFPKFEQITDNIEKITKNIAELLKAEDGKGALSRTIDNIEKISQTLKTLADDKFLKIAMNIEKFTKDINKITGPNVKNLSKIIDNLRQITDNIDKLVDSNDTKIAEAIDAFKGAAGELEGALEAIKNVAQKVERGEGTIGKLLTDDSTVIKINKAVDGINNYIESANRLKIELSYRGEYLWDSRDAQNIVGIKLQPRPDKYFLLEFIDEPVANRVSTSTTLTVDNGTPITTETVSRNDRFSLSVQFAKRFYDLVFRFGLLRNEGGVGVDYNFFNDSLKLSFEAFDFGRDERPHLRTYATYSFLKYLWITAGSDDLIYNDAADSKKYTDMFLGAGIHFTDDDIKTLLTSLPLPGMN